MRFRGILGCLLIVLGLTGSASSRAAPLFARVDAIGGFQRLAWGFVNVWAPGNTLRLFIFVSEGGGTVSIDGVADVSRFPSIFVACTFTSCSRAYPQIASLEIADDGAAELTGTYPPYGAMDIKWSVRPPGHVYTDFSRCEDYQLDRAWHVDREVDISDRQPGFGLPDAGPSKLWSSAISTATIGGLSGGSGDDYCSDTGRDIDGNYAIYWGDILNNL